MPRRPVAHHILSVHIIHESALHRAVVPPQRLRRQCRNDAGIELKDEGGVDDIDEAVAEVRQAVGDLRPFEVTVERGVHMLPALVEPSDPGVKTLTAAHVAVFGTPPEHYYHRGSYDAGGPNAHGVPTVQYGVNGANTLLGEDFVPLSGVIAEAEVLATLILDYLA